MIGAGVVRRPAGVFSDDRRGAVGARHRPRQRALALLDALDNEDVLGAIDVLLPGERETLREPLTELVAELTRIEVLSDDASLAGSRGVDIMVEDGSVDGRARPTSTTSST